MHYSIEEILMVEEETRRQARKALPLAGPGDEEEEEDLRGREMVKDEAIAAVLDEALLSY